MRNALLACLLTISIIGPFVNTASAWDDQGLWIAEFDGKIWRLPFIPG